MKTTQQTPWQRRKVIITPSFAKVNFTDYLTACFEVEQQVFKAMQAK